FAATIVFGPIAVLAPPVTADGLERLWIGPDFGLSGNFDDPLKWLDGEELGIPGEQDTAIFDQAGLYTVSFPIDQSTDRVLVNSGMVTFDFDGASYTLLNPFSNTPSMVIGETEVDTAALEITGGMLHSQFTDIGLAEGAFGMLTVAGPTTQLLNDWQLRVGNQGAGLLSISDGATVTNTNAFVAAGGGSFGEVLITGEATVWNCAGMLAVGKGGFGSLTVTDGAQVSSDLGIIAQELSTFGEVVVTGPGSSWTIFGTLDVGMSGFGTLIIEDGATVTNEVFATLGTFFKGDIPPSEGGVGEVIVVGSGSTWTVNGDLYLGLFAWGRWTLSAGGKVIVDGDLIRGGWLPDSDQPQTIIELASRDDYETPAISVTGLADGFEPRVDLVDGFVPKAGDTFMIAHADLGLLPFAFDLPKLPPPRFWEVIQDENSVALHVGPVIPGDIDGDGSVGVKDLLTLLGDWGPCDDCNDCPADLDDDCSVGVPDLLILLGNWG
ncbi:MAG: hypothetical protein IIA64_11320, partial [Planctomycetes bacterium]|nr:hypothetical protein [Planctomycetota bacterium]